ncbi:hypothetical protein B0O99DRAFT_694613 [Bisporella sp. PMI_857]|nr:hypothetical protein B0O99DRAFT_694613 [Bisporella sp. PMI_857]
MDTHAPVMINTSLLTGIQRGEVTKKGEGPERDNGQSQKLLSRVVEENCWIGEDSIWQDEESVLFVTIFKDQVTAPGLINFDSIISELQDFARQAENEAHKIANNDGALAVHLERADQEIRDVACMLFHNYWFGESCKLLFLLPSDFGADLRRCYHKAQWSLSLRNLAIDYNDKASIKFNVC